MKIRIFVLKNGIILFLDNEHSEICRVNNVPELLQVIARLHDVDSDILYSITGFTILNYFK